jgi:hypothetical protein
MRTVDTVDLARNTADEFQLLARDVIRTAKPPGLNSPQADHFTYKLTISDNGESHHFEISDPISENTPLGRLILCLEEILKSTSNQ